jgi:hypothetical protein
MMTTTSNHISAMPPARDSGLASTGNRAFPVRSLSKWQVEALKKLASFGLLRPNWDSYGSPPISDAVLDAVADLVTGVSFEHVPPLRLTPVSGGSVQLEWERGNRKVAVEVRPDTAFEVLLVDGDDLKEFLVPSLSSVVVEELLIWLGAGPR